MPSDKKSLILCGAKIQAVERNIPATEELGIQQLNLNFKITFYIKIREIQTYARATRVSTLTAEPLPPTTFIAN